MSVSVLQYGQIHYVLREMIQNKYGSWKWNHILQQSALDDDKHFLVFSVYDDSLTQRLIDACVKVLSIPSEAILKEFGHYFLVYCMKYGYDKMLRVLGSDIVSFMKNLDSLHSMLSLSYRGIVTPYFRCEENKDGSHTLHYYSIREGFYPIVVGLIEAVGLQFFNQIVRLSLIRTTKETTGRDGNLQYHASMLVRFRPVGEEAVEEEEEDLVELRKQTSLQGKHKRVDLDAVEEKGTSACFRSEDMSVAFPYHIVMDTSQSLTILQCGNFIQELVTDDVCKGNCTFSDIATILQPRIIPDPYRILNFINSVFLILIHTTDAAPFMLRGQMLWLPNSCKLMFLGSPRLRSLNDFRELKVFLADIALYDLTWELVLLNQQRIAEIDVARKLDEATIAFKRMSKALENEKARTEEILHEMMPPKVAKQLFEHGFVTADKFERGTVLLSDIVTFTDITAMCQADDVLNMLNDMYNRFDTAADVYGIYKVKTIGDAYMACTGVPEFQNDHVQRMANFAMDIIEDAGHVPSPATGLPLQIRLGFHTGQVVAGVIGKKKPRYDIYGETVTTASKMESSGIPGRIHVSEDSFKELFKSGYVFKDRGEIDVKGLRRMNTYFLVGSMDREVEQPEDIFALLPDLHHPHFSFSPFRKKMDRKLGGNDNPIAPGHMQKKTSIWFPAQCTEPTRRHSPHMNKLHPDLYGGMMVAATDKPETWDLSPPPNTSSLENMMKAPAPVDHAQIARTNRMSVSPQQAKRMGLTFQKMESPAGTAPPAQLSPSPPVKTPSIQLGQTSHLSPPPGGSHQDMVRSAQMRLSDDDVRQKRMSVTTMASRMSMNLATKLNIEPYNQESHSFEATCSAEVLNKLELEPRYVHPPPKNNFLNTSECRRVSFRTRSSEDARKTNSSNTMCSAEVLNKLESEPCNVHQPPQNNFLNTSECRRVSFRTRSSEDARKTNSSATVEDASRGKNLPPAPAFTLRGAFPGQKVHIPYPPPRPNKQDERARAVLQRIEPSPFLKPKRMQATAAGASSNPTAARASPYPTTARASPIPTAAGASPKQFIPYSTKQKNLLPFGSTEESDTDEALFSHRNIKKKLGRHLSGCLLS